MWGGGPADAGTRAYEAKSKNKIVEYVNTCNLSVFFTDDAYCQVVIKANRVNPDQTAYTVSVRDEYTLVD